MYLTPEVVQQAREAFGKFVLATTSRGFGRDLRLIAEVLYETSGYLERQRHPTVRADITLVEYGYQIDVRRDEHTGGECACRDFGGAYEIEDMASYLEDKLIELMAGFEKDFCAHVAKHEAVKAAKPRRRPKSKKKAG